MFITHKFFTMCKYTIKESKRFVEKQTATISFFQRRIEFIFLYILYQYIFPKINENDQK